MQEIVDDAVDDMITALRDTAASLSYSFKTGFSLRLLESELNAIYEQRLDSLLSDVRGSATEREVVSMFEKVMYATHATIHKRAEQWLACSSKNRN